MSSLFHPSTWGLADALIIAGGGGLLTGFGGKFFFLVPVIDPSSWAYFNSLFSLYSWPGIASNSTSPSGSGTNMTEAIQVALSFMFNLPLGYFGLDKWTAWNGKGYPPTKLTPWEYEGKQFKPGVLGFYSGYYFLTVLALGIALKF